MAPPVDDRVRVAVSKSMSGLRETQRLLNRFWQTSELAYGFVLSHFEREKPAPQTPTIELFGHVRSHVWYPVAQGRIKHTDVVESSLAALLDNTVQVYRATLLSFYSAFEAYLETEAGQYKRRRDGWGPLVKSLSHPTLRAAVCPLPLALVLRADACRMIRNKMVHQAFAVPQSLDDPDVVNWKACSAKEGRAAGWPARALDREIDRACDWVVGRAIANVAEASTPAKTLPLELFYMLFTFTNLDNLAFAIEEALQPSMARPGPEILRQPATVRRADLILGPVTPASSGDVLDDLTE